MWCNVKFQIELPKTNSVLTKSHLQQKTHDYVQNRPRQRSHHKINQKSNTLTHRHTNRDRESIFVNLWVWVDWNGALIVDRCLWIIDWWSWIGGSCIGDWRGDFITIAITACGSVMWIDVGGVDRCLWVNGDQWCLWVLMLVVHVMESWSNRERKKKKEEEKKGRRKRSKKKKEETA